MAFLSRHHAFEWLVNGLLVVGPLWIIITGLMGTGGLLQVGLGLLFMLPISFGCLLYYGCYFWLVQRPRRLAGYQWGLVAFYGCWFIISLGVIIFLAIMMAGSK
ncbi:hypothetical protein [Lactiplantibacillus carotarum]|uniref:hypothetical protein n=1 Tax=Lactiplantibacillus carotarum TaxID=2993456 RepID=UPI00298F3180|nr:hypothetical protein [Lactiplantibacillus carotarum]